MEATQDALEVPASVVEQGFSTTELLDLLQWGIPLRTAEDRRRARDALRLAAKRKAELLEMVMDALNEETIQPEREEKSALLMALEFGDAQTVNIVVDRMQKEGRRSTGWLWTPFFRSDPSVFADDEVADGVLGLFDASAFETTPYDDCVMTALRCCVAHRWERGVELCLRHGPSMEERLRGPLMTEDADEYPPRLRYVVCAGSFGALEMARKMHDMVPLLPDGSGRRAEVADYLHAICYICGGHTSFTAEKVITVMEFLLEQAGGIEVMDQCDPLLCFWSVELLEWVAEHAPHLVERACKHPSAMDQLTCKGDAGLLESATAKILGLVDGKVIAAMMRQETRGGRRSHGGWSMVGGWRWQMEKLHKAVPESMDGLEWSWLMDAIRDKAYKDVEYMVTMCKREHLVTRNEDGDTAHDVAARDERFPRELLQRLKVAAKGAHA